MKTVVELSNILKEMAVIPTSDKIEYLGILLDQADWQGYNRGCNDTEEEYWDELGCPREPE